MTGFAVEGDVRIDNRSEIRRALGADAGEGGSDLDLVAACYARWGDRCVDRLIGDFAFVLRDPRDGRTFAARDPLGVRPLYFRVSGAKIAFGPSAAAVALADRLPLITDETRVADLLVPALESAGGERTFYRDVRRLRPGHVLSFAGVTLSISRAFRLDPSREIRLAGDGEYVEAFRALFREAVRCRLRGRVSAMLSGGLDSSAIVGFARALALESGGPPLITLSAITDDPGCEETRHVQSVLRLDGLDPVLVRPADVLPMRDEIDRFLHTLEEPFDAAMILPLLMYAAARRRGSEAVLDGLDGDVVASLEPNYLAGLMEARQWTKVLREARGLARFYRGTYAPWSSSLRLLASNAGRVVSPTPARRAWRAFQRPASIREAIRDSVIREDFAVRAGVADRLESLWSVRASTRGESPRERHVMELTHPSIGVALERYDRVARSQEIEPRHPFLDRRVVEFCLAIPWDQKVREGWSKRIVRAATQGLLPDAVRWRRGRWVRLGPRFLGTAISSRRADLSWVAHEGFDELGPYIDRTKLRARVERYDAGDPESGELVWQVVALATWLRNRRAREYDPPAPSVRDGADAHLPAAG